jgi:hypothetical protein
VVFLSKDYKTKDRAYGSVFLIYQSITSISMPTSRGRKRGHTFSLEVITEAASRLPISIASGRDLP